MYSDGEQERELRPDAGAPKYHRGLAGMLSMEHRWIATSEVRNVLGPMNRLGGERRSASQQASDASLLQSFRLLGPSLPRLLAFLLLFLFHRTAPAQKVSFAQSSPMLQADDASQVPASEWRAAFPVRSAFGSLCSLGPLACVLIDRPFAFHARLDLVIRPKAPDGSTGVLLPFAVSVPLFGRTEVGLGSCYAGFWGAKQDADRDMADPSPKHLSGLCPFWLAAKLLIFPWFRDPHKHPALAVEYLFEYQAGPFSGFNQLGMPGPLSKLSLAYRQPFGRLEFGAAISVLVDHRTRAGTLQFGPHIG